MWNLKNNINEQTQQKQTDRYREQTDGCQRGKAVGGLGEKGEDIKKYRLVVIKQSWEVKNSIGNTVNNIVITMYGPRCVLELLGEHFVKYTIA